MWDLAIPFDRPPVSAPNAWEPSEYQTPGIPSSEIPSTPAITAADSKCSPIRPVLSLCAQTARRACMNTNSSASAIATVSINALIAATATTTIPAIDLINSLRHALSDWEQQQLRKIETLYRYHREKQDGKHN